MFPQKVPGKYNCQKCDYHSNKLSQWKRHLTTNKHKMLTDVYTKGSKPSIFTCDCGRSYSLRQSLSRHKQNCGGPKMLTNADGSLQNASPLRVLLLLRPPVFEVFLPLLFFLGDFSGQINTI